MSCIVFILLSCVFSFPVCLSLCFSLFSLLSLFLSSPLLFPFPIVVFSFSFALAVTLLVLVPFSFSSCLILRFVFLLIFRFCFLFLLLSVSFIFSFHVLVLSFALLLFPDPGPNRQVVKILFETQSSCPSLFVVLFTRTWIKIKPGQGTQH
jgi:hypothetical protein